MGRMCAFKLAWILAFGASALAQLPNGIGGLNVQGGSRAPLSGWSTWSGWGECSRSCGGGIREQFRFCQRSRQANGDAAMLENTCQGKNKRYEQCNRNPCPIGRRLTNVDQCGEYNLREFGGKKYFWQPMVRGGPCQLYCSARGHRFFLRRSTRITDGSECSARSRGGRGALGRKGSKRMCIEGKCVRLDPTYNIHRTMRGSVARLCKVCCGDT